MASTASKPKLFPSYLSSKTQSNPNSTFIALPSFYSSNKIRLRGEYNSASARYSEVVVDEEIDKIRRLQNGSDVRGVAVEGEKGMPVNLTPPAVEAIAECFGEWVRNELGREGGEVRVSLGKDPRFHAGF